MTTARQRRLAAVELSFAAVIWGFGFIATRWALEGLGPLWLTSWRFELAFLLALPFLLRERLVKGLKQRHVFRAAFFPGLALGSALFFQTLGLQTTSVGKSAFITSLYVVFVPLFEHGFGRASFHKLHYVLVGIALFGVALMAGYSVGGWSWGDTLTLFCALLSTVHILLLDSLGERITDPLHFNIAQTFWAGLLATLAALCFEPWPSHLPGALPAAGVVILAVGSTLIAFFIQVRSQRILPPSVVSMLFLLESPFAAIFGYLLLGERLSPTQSVGALLILAASTLSTLLMSRELEPSKYGRSQDASRAKLPHC